MEFFKCNSLIVQKTIHFIMVVADVSEIDIKHNTNYRSGFSLVGCSTTKIWNLCHVWDDFIVNDMKSLHTMGRTTELRNDVQFALAKDSWWVCIKVCASSRQGCCVGGDQYHFLLEILPNISCGLLPSLYQMLNCSDSSSSLVEWPSISSLNSRVSLCFYCRLKTHLF